MTNEDEESKSMAGPSVFVSHSNKDVDWCSAFVNALQAADIDAWYDRGGLHAGMQWITTIARELEARDVFLLIITPQSWAAEWVQRELALALLHHKQIVGVIHEPTPDLRGFILIYQLLNVVSKSPDEVAHLVAEELRLSASAPAPEVITLETGDANGEPVVVPQLAEDTNSAASAPARLPAGRSVGQFVSGADEFIASIDTARELDRPALHRLAEWARALEREGIATLSTYYGKRGLTLLPRLVRDGVGLVTLYNFDGPYVQFWRSVFERRAPKLLPQVEQLAAPTLVGQGSWTRVFTEELLEALLDAYREAHGAQNG